MRPLCGLGVPVLCVQVLGMRTCQVPVFVSWADNVIMSNQSGGRDSIAYRQKTKSLRSHRPGNYRISKKLPSLLRLNLESSIHFSISFGDP